MSEGDPLAKYPDYDILVYYQDHVFNNQKFNCADCKFTGKIEPDQTVQDKIDLIIRTSNASGTAAAEGNYSGDRTRSLIVTWYKAISFDDNSVSILYFIMYLGVLHLVCVQKK